MTRAIRMEPMFGQDPSYAGDREGGTLINVLVRIVPTLDDPQAEQVDLAWVQDISGSMQGSKIEAAKEVLRRTVGKLHLNDMFALIAFHEEHVSVIPHGPCTLARRAEADRR